MCKRNLIYTHKKSIAFPAPTFTKSTTFKQHYMQISYQISPKLGNILKVDKYSFMPPNEVQAFSAPIFIKLTHSTNFVENSCSKFYPNLMENMKK